MIGGQFEKGLADSESVAEIASIKQVIMRDTPL
jgi:hypothetical protein